MSETPPIRHPLFARLNARMAAQEPREVREHRQQLLAGLSGRVVEVGVGTGVNFRYYPPAVTEVIAIEPEPFLREKATAAAADVSVNVSVRDGAADHISLADESCDAAVACLVLCSVPDQPSALAELHRVLRPGGELRFYEHVLSRKPSIARSQRFVDRTIWPRMFGGCHTARDTPAAIEAAGFSIDEQRRLWAPPVRVALPVGTHALGIARRA